MLLACARLQLFDEEPFVVLSGKTGLKAVENFLKWRTQAGGERREKVGKHVK